MERRGPDLKETPEAARIRRLTMSLPTPDSSVQKLQTTLHAKAKIEPNFKFYSLWDKITRMDVLIAAYKQCRRNRGAAGVDKETFEDIEFKGIEIWLGKLKQELDADIYRPQPLRRVSIPKGDGKSGERKLSIPTIRDCVVQTAAVLVLSPIFEADFLPSQYGFRPGLDAKMAIRRVYFHVTKFNRREIVEGDLKDYFTSIPHGDLLRSLSRRIADGTVLTTIKGWLTAPVCETKHGKMFRTSEAAKTHRGAAQGSPLSPLMSNVYFRRFLLAWKKFGTEDKLNAKVVNYADDFVICCKPGTAQAASVEMRRLMCKIGLTVNEQKTRISVLPNDTVDFLGYSFCRAYRKDGTAYVGTKPSKKAIAKLIRKIHEETSCRWNNMTAESRIVELNSIIRGWSGYFNQGPVLSSYKLIQRYTERRLRSWLVRKHKQRGAGYGRYPDEFLYGKLGLIKLPTVMADLSKAKV